MNLTQQIKDVHDFLTAEVPELPGGQKLNYYTHVPANAARVAALQLPGVFVEAAYPGGISRDDGWKGHPADIVVNVVLSTHLTNLQEAAELRDATLERIFNACSDHGWHPGIVYLGCEGNANDPRNWAVLGMVCLGPCTS